MGEVLINEREELRRHFLDHARQEGEKSKPNLAIAALGHVVGRNCQDAKLNWIRLFEGEAEEQKSTGLLNEPWKREFVMHRVAPYRNDFSHTVFFTFLPQLCGGSKVAGKKKHKVNRKQSAYDGTWELKSKKKELTTKYLTGQTLKFTERGKISMSMLEVTLKTDNVPVIPLGEDEGMLLSERKNKLPFKITSTGPKRELEESSNQPENNKKPRLCCRFLENLETTNTGSGRVVKHDCASAANICNEELATDMHIPTQDQVQHFPPVGINEIEKLLHSENDEPIEQFGSQGAEVYDEFWKLAQLPTGMSHQADEPNNVVLEMNKANEKGVSHTGLMTSSSQNWHENQLPQLPPHPATEVAHNDAVTQKTPFPPDMRADEFPNFAFPDDDNGLMQNQMDQTPFSPDMRADEFANFGLPDDDNGLMQNQMDQPQLQEYSPVVEPILSTEGAGYGNNDKFEDLDDNVLKHFS